MSDARREERIVALRDETTLRLVAERDALQERVRQMEAELDRLRHENLELKMLLAGDTPVAGG